MNMIITFVLSCLLAGMTYIVLGYLLRSAVAGTAAVVISIVFPIVLSHSFILSKRRSNVKARLVDLGLQPKSLTSPEFGKFIADQTDKWARVIRAANIKPE